MIYDQFPIIDHFRYVNDDMVAGAMDTKQYGDAAYLIFLKTDQMTAQEEVIVRLNRSFPFTH